MIGSTRSLRVFACGSPADMRKGFDGLYGLVKGHLERDPLSGDLYLFVAGNRKRAKVLMWDGTGLCLCGARSKADRNSSERGQGFEATWTPFRANVDSWGGCSV